jgi:hypothetical protein
MSRMLRFLHIDLIAMAILLLACTPEDMDSPAPEDFFVKYFGTSAAEVMIDVQAYDGGYLMLGSTDDGTNKDFLLIKTDSLGSQLWEKEIGFIYNDGVEENIGNDTPGEMIIYDSDHVAIIGTTVFSFLKNDINATRAYVVLVNVKSNDTDGAIIIADNFIFPAIPTTGITNTEILKGNTTGSSLLRPLANGQKENALILLGSSDSVSNKSSSNSGTDIQDIYLNKIDINLTEPSATVANRWPVHFGYNGFDAGVRVVQSENENFNVIATTDNSSGQSGGGLNIDFSIVTFDGVVGDNVTIGNVGDTDDVAADITVNGSRITILGNSSSGNAFIVEIVSGSEPTFELKQIVFDGIFGSTTPGNIGNGIVKLLSGDFFIAGQITGYTDQVTGINKQNDIVLYKVGQLGDLDVNSVKAFGGNGNDIGQAIIQNNDGSLMLGATMDFNGGLTMMSLIKTNSEGELAK